MSRLSCFSRPLRVVAFAAALPVAAFAQDKPLEWVVGYAAGGGSDVVARTVAEPLRRSLERPVIVNNKPGAATNIAAEYVARSRDVGNVMLTADFATLAANPSLFKKLNYSAEKDLQPVGLLARFPLVLVVGTDVPVKDYKEFVAWAKAQANGVTYASAGLGSPHHLAGELLRERSGLPLIHVPYKGAAPAIQDVVGGQVAAMLVDTASGLQFIESGKMKPIAVASAARVRKLPNVPTLIESGVSSFEAYAWQGVAVPAGTPREVIDRLSKSLFAALSSAEVKGKLEGLGLEVTPSTPEQMAAYARTERERWGKLIRDNKITLE
ncbi:MAG TPA: tripartite tricarboxylate transporter substrate binding protein [Burkholderiaceae bacterium]|nr:tripartite tricarboxylate transporter substrate binding protein [Burkholderiaceae bacterium]